MTIRPEVLVMAGAAVVVGLIYVGKNAGAVGSNLGAAAVDMADGLVSGAVFGVGDRVGLSDTRDAAVVSQGQAELAAGDYWNASFHLPAGEFIAGAWNRIIN